MSLDGHCSTTRECALRPSGVYTSPHPPALPHPSSRPLRSANAHHPRALRGRGSPSTSNNNNNNGGGMKEEVLNESSATLTSSNLDEDASHTVRNAGAGATGSQQVIHPVARSTASHTTSSPALHNKSAQDDTAMVEPLLPPISPHPHLSLREERNVNANGSVRGHKGRANMTATATTTTSTTTTMNTTTTTNTSTNSTSNGHSHSSSNNGGGGGGDSSTSSDGTRSGSATPYLRSHGIPVMLNRLYRSVLQTRPEDKLQFIIDELQRQTQQEAEETGGQDRPKPEPPAGQGSATPQTTMVARMPTTWPDGQQHHMRSSSPVTLTPFTPPSPVPPLRPTSARHNILLLAATNTNTTSNRTSVVMVGAESAGSAAAAGRPVVLSSSSASASAATATAAAAHVQRSTATTGTRAHAPAPRETTSPAVTPAQRQSTGQPSALAGATSPETAVSVSVAPTTPPRRTTPAALMASAHTASPLLASSTRSTTTTTTTTTVVVSRNGLATQSASAAGGHVRLSGVSVTSPNMTQFVNTQYSVTSNSTTNATLAGNAGLERDENGSRGELSSTFSVASIDVAELLQEIRAHKIACFGAAQREVSLQELAHILHTGCFDFLDVGLVQDLFDELSAPFAASAVSIAAAANNTNSNNNNNNGVSASCRVSLNAPYSPSTSPTMSSLHTAATLPWRAMTHGGSTANNNNSSNNSLTRSTTPGNLASSSNNNNNAVAAAAVSAAAAATASSLPIKADSRCSLHDAIYEAAEHPTRIAAAAELTQPSLILPASSAIEDEVNALLWHSEPGRLYTTTAAAAAAVVDFEALLARIAYKIQGHYPEEVIRHAFLDLVAEENNSNSNSSSNSNAGTAVQGEAEGKSASQSRSTSAALTRSQAGAPASGPAGAALSSETTTNATMLLSEPSNTSTTSGHPLRSISHTRVLTNGLLSNLSSVTSPHLYGGSQRLNDPASEESYNTQGTAEQPQPRSPGARLPRPGEPSATPQHSPRAPNATRYDERSVRQDEARTATPASSPPPVAYSYHTSEFFGEETGNGESHGMDELRCDALQGVALEQLARTVPLSRCLHDGLERRLGLRHLSPAELHAGLRVLGAADCMKSHNNINIKREDEAMRLQQWGCHVNDFIKLVHTVVAVRQSSAARTSSNAGMVASALSRLSSPAANAMAVTSLAPSPTSAALTMKRNELYAARHAASRKIESAQAHIYVGSCTGVRQ